MAVIIGRSRTCVDEGGEGGWREMLDRQACVSYIPPVQSVTMASASGNEQGSGIDESAKQIRGSKEHMAKARPTLFRVQSGPQLEQSVRRLDY